MKVVIDENLQGKELYNFLIQNKSALIAQKKALPKKCDPIGGLPSFYNIKAGEAAKTAIGEIPADADSIRAEFIANAALWLDSQRDVLIPDCWSKTVREGNGRLHMKDHTYEMDAEVGDVVDIYSKDVSLYDLGVNKTGVTQCLVYVSDVQRVYDEKTFIKYKKGKVNQHSIGLIYVKIQLAVNDEDYKEEFAVWQKYIDRIINKEEAESIGYFWAVTEIKLIEASAVIAGANRLTPTLWVGAKSNQEHNENKGDSTPNEPDGSTHEEPQKSFDVDAAIKQITIINPNSI